jgi:hypothetical protein
MMKWVTIELNAYAATFDYAHVSAAQVNRQNYSTSDYGLEAVAEGISIAQNASVVWGLMQSEEQKEFGHATAKNLKNRFGKRGVKHTIALDFELMQIRDVDPNDVSSTPNVFESQQQRTVPVGRRIIGAQGNHRPSVKGISV